MTPWEQWLDSGDAHDRAQDWAAGNPDAVTDAYLDTTQAVTDFDAWCAAERADRAAERKAAQHG